jgi:hypothetical protein
LADRGREGWVLGLLCRVDLTMQTACQPSFLSREARTTFEDSSGILLHEHRFPDLQSLTWLRNIELKDWAHWGGFSEPDRMLAFAPFQGRPGNVG